MNIRAKISTTATVVVVIPKWAELEQQSQSRVKAESKQSQSTAKAQPKHSRSRVKAEPKHAGVARFFKIFNSILYNPY